VEEIGLVFGMATQILYFILMDSIHEIN